MWFQSSVSVRTTQGQPLQIRFLTAEGRFLMTAQAVRKTCVEYTLWEHHIPEKLSSIWKSRFQW